MSEDYVVPKTIIKVSGEPEQDGQVYMPIGCILQFTGEEIPKGWVETDGRTLFVNENQELYGLIGNHYMPEVYTIEVKRWWIFRWTTYKRFDIAEEFGVFRLPKIWNARFTSSNI